MNIKLLIAMVAVLGAGGLNAYTETLINHTPHVVNVQFPIVGIDPQMVTINPSAKAEYSSGIKLVQGVTVASIMLPSGRVVGGSVSNAALKERFAGRACGFTWHLFAEEMTKPTVKGNTYMSTPDAIKFYLFREPCGGIGGSLYPGGSVDETKWLDPASGAAKEGPKKANP